TAQLEQSSSSHFLTLTPDTTIPSGDHYLLAVFDSGSAISEANEANNRFCFSGVYLTSSSALVVHGGEGSDFVYLSGGSSIDVTINSATTQFSASAAWQVYIYLHGGYDGASVNGWFATTVYGGDGGDSLHGSSNGDSLFGGEGNDYLMGY